MTDKNQNGESQDSEFAAKTFELPSFIFDKAQADAAYEAVQAVRKHLDMLDKCQLCVEITEFFAKNPEITHFSVSSTQEYDDNGNYFTCYSCRFDADENHPNFRDDEDRYEYELSDELEEVFSGYSDEQTTYAFERAGKIKTGNFLEMMRIAAGPEAAAEIEKAYLNKAADKPNAAKPASKAKL